MRLIGPYLVAGLLGRGGMGSVYKVRRPEAAPGAPFYALKLLDPRPELTALWGEREIRRSFLAEADTLAGLAHPNLVKVRGRGEDRGRPYYLMDHLCDNLAQAIGEAADPERPTRRLGLDAALDLVRQTLMGLAALHAAGVVHRDVKPANLMLDWQERVLLGDLGLSRLRGERRPTPPNLLVGSPFYAAPEQRQDPESAGPAADLYAAGRTLARLVTGRLPGRDAPPPSRYNPDLDPAWDRFLARACARRPEGRFADAEEMLAGLEELAEAWEARKEAACRLHPGPPQSDGGRRGRLRAAPAHLGPRIDPAGIGLDGLWRPADPWPPLAAGAGEAVLQPAAGLIWQRGGSTGPLSWSEALEYVAGLRRQGLAGRRDWRLPTAPELAAILRPPAHAGEDCTPPAFDPRQARLWSADRRTFSSAFFAHLAGGYLAWQDLSCPAFARAVAGTGPAA